MTKKDYSVPALEKAMMILNELDEHGDLSISEIHHRLNIPKSSAFVILNTLEKHRMIERVNEGRFRLGPFIFQLGMSFYRRIDIASIARSHLQRLVDGTPYTAHLAVLMNDNPVYIDKVEGSGFVRFATAIGQSMPLHASGVGKALASGMTDEEIIRALDGRLESYTAKSYRSIEEVLEDIRMVRKTGYSIEDEQMEEGIRCIGAPIVGRSGKVEASISITALSKDLPIIRIPEIGFQVANTAMAISYDMGYAPPSAP